MRLLIIDDNKDITEAIRYVLELEGHECNIVDNGFDGLDEIMTNPSKYNLILLDIAMPEFSGIDLLMKLQNEHLIEKENIVIFTAFAVTDKDCKRFLNAGAKGILRKPLSLDELFETIKCYSE